MRWWWLGAWITKVLYSPLFVPSPPPHNASNASNAFMGSLPRFSAAIHGQRSNCHSAAIARFVGYRSGLRPQRGGFPVPRWHQSVLCYADETADGMYGDAYVVDYVPDVPTMDFLTIAHLCLGGTVPGVVRVFHFDRVASSEILDRVQERIERRDWEDCMCSNGDTKTPFRLSEKGGEAWCIEPYSLYRHNCAHFVESFRRNLDGGDW